jgi:hypothetical protein
VAEKLDDEGLKALLSNEIRSAAAYDDTELSGKRARAMEYFKGVMSDTPSMSGRSSVVSKDVADTIGWMLPGIIRVFTASDQMAMYEPTKPNDEEFAKQATDYCNYVFMKDNPGYRILWDSTHDSLLLGNGIVKHWWDKKEECEYSEHSGLTEEQISIILSDGDAEIVAQKQGEPQMVHVPDQMGNLVPLNLPTFDVKIKRVTRNGRLRVECIEAEDFLMDREATTIEEARFCAHRDHVTRSDLIKMGFKRELVESLPVDRYSSMQEEKLARDSDARTYFNMVGHESMMLVELYECYVKADIDGDGEAEMVRAFYAGASGAGELLDWEVWEDDVPFSDIPCEPVPHRWDARSVSDDVSDIQRVKTVLTRQFLDNLYWVNNPANEAEHNSVINPDALTSPKFGATIWRKPGAMPITPLAIPFIGDKALLGLQHFDQVREMRTGVSRSTMALDPEALQNQTATASQNQKDSAYSQIELIARNQAELGWRRVFKQILKLIVKHQDRPRTIRLRDEWVEMDPRSWNAAMDVTINVGLGTGSRDRDMAMLNTILGVQMSMTDRLAGSGFAAEALDMVPKINLTATKLAESAGIKNPEQFFLNLKPEDLERMKEEAANRPNPEMEMKEKELQADMQIKQVDMQMRGQELQAKAQLDERADMRKAEIERMQAEADIATNDRKVQADIMLAEKKFELERELALIEAQIKASEHQQNMQMKMVDQEGKREEREAKAKAGPKAAIEVKHGADELTGPIAEALSKFGEQMSKSQEMHSQALMSVLAKASAPKRVVRDPKTNRVVGVETIQ